MTHVERSHPRFAATPARVAKPTQPMTMTAWMIPLCMVIGFALTAPLALFFTDNDLSISFRMAFTGTFGAGLGFTAAVMWLQFARDPENHS